MMLNKDKVARDEFTLSLDGMRTISSFALAPAIAHDRLRQDRKAHTRGTGQPKRRLWILRRFGVA